MARTQHHVHTKIAFPVFLWSRSSHLGYRIRHLREGISRELEWWQGLNVNDPLLRLPLCPSVLCVYPLHSGFGLLSCPRPGLSVYRVLSVCVVWRVFGGTEQCKAHANNAFAHLRLSSHPYICRIISFILSPPSQQSSFLSSFFFFFFSLPSCCSGFTLSSPHCLDSLLRLCCTDLSLSLSHSLCPWPPAHRTVRGPPPSTRSFF